MLSRKTLGVAGAAMLGTMALMATNVANAVIIVGGTGTHADVKYAKEDLLDTEAGTHTKDGMKYYLVASGATDLNIQATTGISGTTTSPVYLRVELENMVFGVAVATAVSGGTVGSDFAVLEYTDGTGTANRTVATTSFGVMPDMPGSVTVTSHVSALDAYRGQNAIADPQVGEDVVMVVDGIVETGTSSMSVAEVETGFTKFVTGADAGGAVSATLAAIGMLEIETADSVLDQTGTAATTPSTLLGTTTPIIMITYKGDFSEHTYSLNGDADCATTVIASSVNADKTELTPTDAIDGSQDVMHYLCVQVADDNDMMITDAPFTATVKYAAVTDAAFPRMEMTETIGRIGRNGTHYHIPYLTTHEAYRQRVVIVNRGAETTYSFGNFQAEGDAMPEAGGMAMGDLPMGQTVLRSTDIVSGVTRAAATLSIVAARGNISAAIQQVTLGNAVVDTVYLEAVEN